MDNLQFVIAQGSTPKLSLAFPFEVDADDVVYASIAQDGKVKREWTMNGSPATDGRAGTGTLEIDEDDASVMVLSMTQADSLALTAGDAELQIRIKTSSGADTFLPLVGAIVKAHKTGEIT